MRHYGFPLTILVLAGLAGAFALRPARYPMSTVSAPSTPVGSPLLPQIVSPGRTPSAVAPSIPELHAPPLEPRVSTRSRTLATFRNAHTNNRLSGFLPKGWKWCDDLVAIRRGQSDSATSVAEVGNFRIFNKDSAPNDSEILWVVSNPSRQRLGVVTGYVFAKLKTGAEAAELANQYGYKLVRFENATRRAVFQGSTDESTLNRLKKMQADPQVESVRLEVHSGRVERQ